MSSALGRSLSESQLDASQRRSSSRSSAPQGGHTQGQSPSRSHAATQNAASTKRLMSILQNRPVGMKEINQHRGTRAAATPAAASSAPAVSPFASSVRPRASSTSHDILTSFRQELERVRYDVDERWRRTEQMIEDAMRKTMTRSNAQPAPVKQTTNGTLAVDADAINFIPLLEPMRSSPPRVRSDPPNPFFLPLSSTPPFRRHTRQSGTTSSPSSSLALDDDADLADLHARGSSLLRRHQSHSLELAQSRLHSLLEQLHALKSTHNSALDSELNEIEAKYAHDARKLQEEYDRSKHALRTKALQQAEATQLKFTQNVQQHVSQLHHTLEKELSVNSPSSAYFTTTIRHPPSAATHSSPLSFDSSMRLEHLDGGGATNIYSSYRRPRSRHQQQPSPSKADLRTSDLYNPAITDLLHSSEDDEVEEDKEQLKQKLIAQAAYLQRARASIRNPLKSSPFRPSASTSSHRSSAASTGPASSSSNRSHRSHQQQHPRSAASLLIVTSSEEDEEENAQSLPQTSYASTNQHRPASSLSSSSRAPVQTQNRRSHLFDSGEDEDDVDSQSTMRRSTSHRYSPNRTTSNSSSNLSSSHSSLKDLARRLHSRIASIQNRS